MSKTRMYLLNRPDYSSRRVITRSVKQMKDINMDICLNASDLFNFGDVMEMRTDYKR